jgi:cobalt-zinc-cadmium efflux system membrane fusion protein
MFEFRSIKSRLREMSPEAQAIVFACAALGVAAIVGIGSWFKYPASGSPPAIGPQTSLSVAGTFRPTKAQWESFKLMTVQSMTFQTELVTDGVIANNDDTTTPVFSPYSGRISKLIAKLGDVVKKGAPLMMVETSDFIQARNNLIAAVAAFDAARGQLEVAQTAEQHQHDLYLENSAVLKGWQQSQSSLAVAQNTFDTDQSVLSAARDQVRLLGNSEVEIDAIEHDPNRQKVNLGAYVLAPISGTVIQRQVGLGQYITSASAGTSTPAYTISNLSTVWLIANVRESDAPKMRLGQPVEVAVTAYPGKLFKARVTWVASSVDPNTHRLPVRAEVENPGHALKPMMFASFKISVGKDAAALGIPQSAVVYEGSEAHVWIARDDGTIVSRQVRIGRTNNGMVEISSGLREGEKVITSGTLFIDRAAENDNS